MKISAILDGPFRVMHWEEYADRIEGYARADGLALWEQAEVERFNREHAEVMSWMTAVDRDLRSAAIKALGPNPSVIWTHLIGAIVIATWDAARRAAGEPDLCVGGSTRMRQDYPCSSLGNAMAVYEGGMPSLGRMTASVQDGGSDKQNDPLFERWRGYQVERARMLNNGRSTGHDAEGKRRGGFLPVEFTPAVQTKTGTSRAPNEGAAVLFLSVDAAFDEAWSQFVASELAEGNDLERQWPGVSIEGVRISERLLLSHVAYGDWVTVSSRERVGGEKGKGGRGRNQRKLERMTMGAMAAWAIERGDPDSVQAIIKRVQRYRTCLENALRKRELIPPKQRRERRANTAPAPSITPWS